MPDHYKSAHPFVASSHLDRKQDFVYDGDSGSSVDDGSDYDGVI